MREALLLFLCVTTLIANESEMNKMEHWSFPPSTATGDEKNVSDHAGFDNCEAAIQAFAFEAKAQITDRKYSVSKQWGKVLRAKVLIARHGLSATTLVTCWTGSGPGVQLVADFQGCGPQQGC